MRKKFFWIFYISFKPVFVPSVEMTNGFHNRETVFHEFRGHPAEMIHAIRTALKPDGTWLIADIKSAPTFEENLEKNPMTSLMYAFSVMGCMSSALSEPGGAGLGTLGFNEQVARAMTAQVGFSRFTRHDFDNPFNAYYEVRV